MTTRSRPVLVRAVLALGVAIVAASCAVPIADLGGSSSAAADINEAGVVVGVSELPGSTPAHRLERAYVRHHDDTVMELPPLPGHDTSYARGINDAGVVIGQSWGWFGGSGERPPALMARGVMWDASGNVTELGSLDGAATEPIDINSSGVIVGSAGLGSFVFHPAVGHVEPLPALPGTTQSEVRAINDEGIAVGYAYLDVVVRPVRWDLAAGTAEDISSWFDEQFFPYGLNDAGSMVGNVGNPSPAGPEAAVVLAGSSEVVRIGAGPSSWAVGINSANTVVATSPGEGRAFRWQPSTGIVELAPGRSSFVLAINDAGSMVGFVDDRAAFFGVAREP